MYNPKQETVRVVKTDQLNQRKLIRIARRYGVSPAVVRELQIGQSVDIHAEAARQMERDGFVKRVRTQSTRKPERLNTLTTEDATPTVTPEDNAITDEENL